MQRLKYTKDDRRINSPKKKYNHKKSEELSTTCALPTNMGWELYMNYLSGLFRAYLSSREKMISWINYGLGMCEKVTSTLTIWKKDWRLHKASVDQEVTTEKSITRSIVGKLLENFWSVLSQQQESHMSEKVP